MLLVIGGLVVLLVGFYQVENWRGRVAWEEAVAMVEAHGETQDWDELAPEPVPDEDNFGAIPLLKGITEVVDGDEEAGEAGVKRERIRGARLEHGRINFRSLGSSAGTGILTDLVRLRSDLSWPALMEGIGVDVGDGKIEAATKLLSAIEEQSDGVLEELSEGLERRESQLSPSVHQVAKGRNKLAIVLPHVNTMTDLTELLGMRGIAAVQSGDREAAFESCGILLKLAEATGGEGAIGMLTAQTQRSAAVDILWEGLVDQLWEESDLLWYSEAFGRIDLEEEYLRSIRLELVAIIESSDWLESQLVSGLLLWPMLELNGIPERALRLFPRGWFDQNRATVVRWTTDYLTQPADSAGIMGVVAIEDKLGKASLRDHARFAPYTWLAASWVPPMQNMAWQAAI